ncbi:hypothetical protein NE237_022776 [Protea cynaroides]|uniref:Transcription initiation factor IIA subunit 2 n=1 Tax=Protea cynaroides TaxID=273540 RepID=A0A9Q0K4T0_9MAGN|nr:hypothetical protein NE237_022776 [Protea cynaroides]
MDGIIDTVSAEHPLLPLFSLVKTHGKIMCVGAPERPPQLLIIPLLFENNRGRRILPYSLNVERLDLGMATFELYRRSTIGMCLTETLDEMVLNGTLTPELAIQVLIQFDKSMTEALETQVKSKVSIKGHLHTYRFCDNVWTFILQDALFKNEESQENVGKVKIVACDSKLLTQ